jgi:hypothetical protein
MKMPIRLGILTVLVAVVVMNLGQSAHAAFGVTSVVGATLLPAPPPPNALPGSNEVPLGFPVPVGDPLLFPEVLGGVIIDSSPLGAGLDVDHDGSNVVASPTISGNVVNPLLIDTTIPVGTSFNSYMFHFDPAAAPDIGLYITTINFDSPVLGVQLFSDGFALEKPSGSSYTGTLEQGDFQMFVQAGGVPPYFVPGYYATGLASRGVEEDFFMLAIAGNTVRLVGSSSGVEIDQVRILTGVGPGGIPEPASGMAWALISFLGGSISLLRRQG